MASFHYLASRSQSAINLLPSQSQWQHRRTISQAEASQHTEIRTTMAPLFIVCLESASKTTSGFLTFGLSLIYLRARVSQQHDSTLEQVIL